MEHCDRKILLQITVIHSLYTFATYVSLVIFALFLSEKTSVVQASVIVAVPAIMRVFSGFISYRIERRIGTIRVLLIAICIRFFSCLLYTVFDFWWELLIIALIDGVAELLYQPIAKGSFANAAKDAEGTELVHRVRYLSICVAGLIGPIVGGFIADRFGYLCCIYISAALYLAACVSMLSLPKQVNATVGRPGMLYSGSPSASCMFENKQLLICILCGTLVYAVFSQFESVYSLALDSAYDNPAIIYSFLLSLNSFAGILLQSYIIWRSQRNKDNMSVGKGIVCFQIGFILFAAAFHFTDIGVQLLILGVLIYSVGEVVVIPGLDVQIDKISSPDTKSLYFGMAEIRTIGFVVGPIGMSWLLDNTNATWMCLVCVMVLFIALICNSIAVKGMKSK